jgi:type III secretion system HrpE/YscL family protein
MSDEPIRRIVRTEDLDGVAIEPLFDRSTRIVKADVVRTVEQVHDQLATAREEANRIIARAREEAEAIRASAHAEGRDAGWKAVVEHVAAAEEARAAARQSAERDMLDLAFGLAERIVGRALDRDPALFGDLVAEKLERVRSSGRITVRVHPDDEARLRQERGRLVSHIDDVPLHFEADPSLNRGDCILETDRGRLDARIETQLDEMRQALRQGGEDD